MNSNSLTVLRGKLTALETGFLLGMYEANELKQEAGDLLTQYPDMPEVVSVEPLAAPAAEQSN